MKIGRYIPIIVAVLLSGAVWAQEEGVPTAGGEVPAEEAEVVAEEGARRHVE